MPTEGDEIYEQSRPPSSPTARRTNVEASAPHFFRPTTVEEVRSLNEGEVLEGYLDGVHGEPSPNAERSISYCHGWRNGMRDRGDLPFDDHDAALAQQFDRLR